MAKSKKTRKNKGSSRASSVAKVGATALVAGLGLFRSHAVDAKIIFTDIPDEEIFNTSYALDVNNDQVVDFDITHTKYNIAAYNLVAAGRGIDQYNFPYVAMGMYNQYAAALFPGETIDANRTWQFSGVMGHKNSPIGPMTQSEGVAPTSPWPGQGNKYLGLQLRLPDGKGNLQSHYGWAALSVDPHTLEATLFGYAYEDEAGKGIGAGAVPAPSSLLLLATGAAALVASRRNRNA